MNVVRSVGSGCFETKQFSREEPSMRESAMHNKGCHGIYTVDIRAKNFQYPFLTWQRVFNV